MAAFGWSAGDIVAAIRVVTKVSSALQDAGGASEEYQHTIKDLESLEIVLQYLQHLKPEDANFAHVKAICARSQASQRALRDLLDGFHKFEKSMGGGTHHSWHRGAHRKAQWALFASNELNKFQVCISMQLQAIQLLLNCHQLSSIHASRIALEEKTAKQTGSIIELKDGLVKFEKDLSASRAKEMAMLANLATVTNSIQETTTIDHNLTLMGIGHADRQSRQIMKKLEDVKSAVDLLGQLNQQNQTQALESADSTCCSIQKYSDPDSCQMAILEAAEHICQLLYLIGVGMHALIRRILLLYPSLNMLLQICYASVPRGPTRLLDGNIQFTDALGRSISLDYTIFKSWRVFDEFVRDQFKGHPGEYHVLRGKYLVFDRKGLNRVISSKDWSFEVSPGSKILMSVQIAHYRVNGNRCPRLSCGHTAVKSCDGHRLTCLSCSLSFYTRTLGYEERHCSTPLCTGTVKIFDSVDSATCHICGLRTLSKSAPIESNALSQPNSSHQIVEITDEDEQLNNVEEEIEIDSFTDQEELQEEDLVSLDFTPISINRHDTALIANSTNEALSGLESAILRTKRKKLELRLSRMDSIRRETEDAEDAQQRYQEQTAIESLKSIHLILDPESKPPTSVLGSEFSPAQQLLQARMRLLEGLKSGKLKARKKNIDEGQWSTGMEAVPARVGTVLEIQPPPSVFPGDDAPSYHKLDKLFVVIQMMNEYSICLRISTYSGLGTTDPHINSSTHALIYNTKRMPHILPEENGMKPAVFVSSDNLLHPLDPMSRVSLEKVYNIRSSIPWKLRGHVQGKALESLQTSFNECFKKNFDLAKAASEGKTRAVVRLLAEGADPNAVVGVQGNTLFEAIRGGHYDLAKLLLTHDAEPYLGFAQEMTDSPLHMAITRRNPTLVRSIVKRSICLRCYQQPNQKALVKRASVALAKCEKPAVHLRNFQKGLDKIWTTYFEHDYKSDQMRKEMIPFCPQMWPILAYLPAAVIVAYRAEMWSPYKHESSSSLPTRDEMAGFESLEAKREKFSRL